MASIKVRTPDGVACWLLSDTLDKDTDAPLACLDHCDDDGELLVECAMELSHAHLMDGVVLRYHEPVCKWDELVKED